MRLTDKIIKNIIKLLENGFISQKVFTKNELLRQLEENNSVLITGKTNKTIILNSKETLFKTLKQNGYNVKALEGLKKLLAKDKNLSKIDNLDYFEHTKVEKSGSFEGIMLSSFSDIEIFVNNEPTIFYKTLCGTGVFFHHSLYVKIPNNVILVGVENPEVMWHISRFSHLFSKGKMHIFLSLSEYKTSFQYKWIETFSGIYIHFGDFDLAGINIYLNRIIPRLKKCKSHSFLIPKNIYRIMKNKNFKKDYFKQIQYKNITSYNKDLQQLINFINDEKITLEQEFLRR